MEKRNFGKKLIIIGVVLLALAAGGGTAYYFYVQNDPAQQEEMEKPPQLMGQEDLVRATGTTSTGLIEKQLQLSFLDADLVVDEVYVSSQDEVKKGEKVLKLTDSSYTEAYRELERAQKEAALAYRQGVIDYELGKLEAEDTLNRSNLEAEYAQTIYEDTVRAAQIKVDQAQDQVDDITETVDEYTDSIETDFYYRDYQVEEKKAAYERNLALFQEKLKDYDYELDDDDDDDPNTFNIVRSEDNEGKNDDGEATVLNLLKSEYQENKEEYEDALKDYEAAKNAAESGIEDAKAKLEVAKISLEQVRIDLEKEKVSAGATMETAKITSQKARDTYDTTMKNLEEKLEVLKDGESEASENLADFQEIFDEDGCVYTETSGTIYMINASANTTLNKDTMLMAYSDAEIMEVTASVDQADIAKLEVGEQAAVVIQDQDTITGVIKSINPVTSSSSRAFVTYSVVLSLEGDISSLSANLTASVYFGIDAKEYDAASAKTTPPMGGKPASVQEGDDIETEEGGVGIEKEKKAQ